MTGPFVINLVNTAFGVTVLAVPYCFHQCGLILGTFLLVAASYASKKSCSLLLRSAQISRKRNFESLGFHVGGFLGKFIVEMSLIGYLVGTAIAWFVIIGDVSPAVVSSLFGIQNTWGLRRFLIVGIGIGVVLPLSLVKDITSLSSASNVAIGIYTIFVLQLLFSTLPTIFSGDWVSGVNFWKPDGVLQSLPIFGISFLCQTVVFVLYEALPEPSGKKMEHVVDTAMDIVLLLSFTVGFSGYVMYYKDGVEGDLLNNYSHDFISEFIRLGFCISTILSFPLLVFPCRASINSLISSVKMNTKEATPAGGNYIPHDRFLIITFCLIVGTFICGILFPNVEFVMALVGATMGAMLTFILPSYIFLKVAGEDTSKTEAKFLLVLGVSLFCLSTFSVLSVSESQQPKIVDMQPVINPVQPILNPPTIKPTNKTFVKNLEESSLLSKGIEKLNNSLVEGLEVDKRGAIDGPKRNTAEVIKESRKEPALPQEAIIRSDLGKQVAQDKLEDSRPRSRNQLENAGVVEDEGRLPKKIELKSHEEVLKREEMKVRAVEDRALKDEVRIGERKILNNGEDVVQHGNSEELAREKANGDGLKSVTGGKEVRPNTNVAGQGTLIVEKPRDETTETVPTTQIVDQSRNVTTGNIYDKIVTDAQNMETRPSNTSISSEIIKYEVSNIANEHRSPVNDSDFREKRMKNFKKIQAPVFLRKHIKQSRLKLLERKRRLRSDKNEM